MEPEKIKLLWGGLLTLLFLQCASESIQYDPVDNYFPSCVGITDLKPYPYSFLEPTIMNSKKIYIFHITFSKPILWRMTRQPNVFIFLTATLRSPYRRHYGYIINMWQGSERSLLLYFIIAPQDHIVPRYYLVITGKTFTSKEIIPNMADYNLTNNGNMYCEGLKCYQKNMDYTNNVPNSIMIIGEYYFHEHLYQVNGKFQSPTPQRVQLNPFCSLQKIRPLYFPSNSLLDPLKAARVIAVSRDADIGEVYLNTQTENPFVRISITLEDQKDRIVQLPKAVKALTDEGFNTTVALPNWRIQIQPLVYNTISIPTKIKTVYQVRERAISSFSNDSEPTERLSNIPRPMKIFHGTRTMSKVITCPDNSRRNPTELRGKVKHIIDYGSFYHMLEPRFRHRWSITGQQQPGAYLLDESGRRLLNLELQYDRYQFPEAVMKALMDFVCIFPSSAGIAYRNLGGSNGIVHIQMDKCIFVPRDIAYSTKCGGLMLFKNTTNLDQKFCDSNFGDCIGKLITRYPIMLSFGRDELTGWTECSKTSESCAYHSPSQEHSVGKLYLKDKRHVALSRLVLRLSSRSSIRHRYIYNRFDSTNIVLLPKKSDYSPLKVLVKVNKDITILLPELLAPNSHALDCNDIWSLKRSSFSFAHPNASSALLIAKLHNYGKGGTDLTFKVECSGNLESDGEIKQWIEPLSTTTANFMLSAELARFFSKVKHLCKLNIQSYRHPEIPCVREIYTYYGSFHDPCLQRVELPWVRLVYYTLPLSYSNTIPSLVRLQKLLGRRYSLLKIITVVPQITEKTKDMIWASRSLIINIDCSNDHIVVLGDDNYVPNNLSDYARNHLYYEIISSKRHIFFFSSDISLEQKKNVLISCDLELLVNLPNGYCVKKANILQRTLIPFNRPKKKELEFLQMIYTKQPTEIITVMLGLVLSTLTFCICLISGYTCKYSFRRYLVKHINLTYYKKRLKEVRGEHQNYWDDPNTYLLSSPFGPHFILHNYKSTEPLNIENLSTFRLVGTLKYKEKELSVIVGEIQHIFINKKGTVWLHAISGVYLLNVDKCASDYVQEMCDFLRENGVKNMNF